MQHFTTIAGSVLCSLGFGTIVFSPNEAGLTVAGVCFAVAWVLFIERGTRKDGTPKSQPIIGAKLISTFICGICLPGIARDFFKENPTVQSLETLWNTWVMAGFLCGMVGWSVIWTLRKAWLRRLRNWENSKAIERILGPIDAEDVIALQKKDTTVITAINPTPPKP